MQIEGNLAQAEDAIMLDKDGFVSETNATNIVSEHTFVISRSRYLS
jgi:protein-lysine N-methyltransferase EEF2KMT